ncbi:MAG: hypothetical protein WCA46_18925, partial [Actinocatenispora sp.]
SAYGPPSEYGPPSSYGPPPNSGPTGPARASAPPATPPPRNGRPVWPRLLAGAAVVLVLAGLLVGSYLLVRHDGAGQPAAGRHRPHTPPASASAAPERSPLDVGSRRTDSRPLTTDEVFGPDDVTPDAGRDAVYHVLKRDRPDAACTRAGTGKVPGVLHRYGCDQVVRATLAAPTDGYVLTAGICNLTDADGARSASDDITSLGRQARGNFAGLAAPGAGRLDRSATVAALQPYGHYLLYVVVGRADGAAPSSGAETQQIVSDLVQTYLPGIVDARRDGG